MDFENLSTDDLFVEPKKKGTLIIAITDDAILQLLKDKDVFVPDPFNTIIIKRIRSDE